MSPRGVPAKVPPSGNASGRAAFDRAMRRLADVEALDVYAEMCALADQHRRVEASKERHANGNVVVP